MDVAAQKQELRRSAVARILGLAPDDRRRQEDALAARFPTLPGVADASTLLLYVSAFPEEVDTAPLLRWVLERGRTLVCPRVDRRERRLRLYRVDDPATGLVRGAMNIPEPRRDLPQVDPPAIDWVLAPGLAFDPRGYRLGRGAGYYDRLLPTLRPDAMKWAICLDCQWVDALPAEPHDAPLDGITSPARTATPPDAGRV